MIRLGTVRRNSRRGGDLASSAEAVVVTVSATAASALQNANFRSHRTAEKEHLQAPAVSHFLWSDDGVVSQKRLSWRSTVKGQRSVC
jgi:predicted transcriptional regulator